MTEREEALEEAAKVAEDEISEVKDSWHRAYSSGAKVIAARIRALKSSSPPPKGGEPKAASEHLSSENARLREALGSIARNTCCDPCREAALVARAALSERTE